MTDPQGIPGEPDESIGVTLARLRHAGGMSGVEAARRAGMSQSRVSRIETGVRYPSADEVRRLARALNADDRLVDILVGRAEFAQRRPSDWRPAAVGLASTQRVIAGQEAEVQTIRAFESTIIHGLLQTGEYARSLLSVFQMQEVVAPGDEHNRVASVTEALTTRIGRQEILTDPRRSFHFVLMEAALNNNFCPPEDMLGQIRRLREVNEQYDNVSIRIVPASAEPAIPALHGFELFDDNLVTVDTFNTSLTSTSQADILLYRHVFDSFDEQATTDINPIIARYQIRYAKQVSSRADL